MTLTYEIPDVEERLNVMMTPGCWFHCCVHGGWGNTEW